MVASHPMEKEIRVLLNVGKKVSYPCQGPCLVAPVVKRVVDGKLTEFHRLMVLDQGGGELLVPIDKAAARGIRKLVNKSEIPKLLDRLNKASASAERWNQRARENLILLTSGSAFDLAEVVGALSELAETKRLQPSDRQTLDRAKKLLACEVSEVMGETKGAAEQRIDEALGLRKGNKDIGKKAERDWPGVEHYGEVL